MNQSGRKQSAGELHRRQQQQQQTTPEPVSRRHSRNRLVLIGPGATGAKTAEQRDGHETGARDRRMMIDDQSGELDAGADLDDPELTRKHPSKLTHGFWLRRYSGLHAAAGGAAQSRPAPGPPESDPQRAGSDATAKSARRPDRGRSRLFARWTSAVVSRGHHFGGSATGVSGADQGATGRSGATSAPPSSSAAALEMGGVRQLGRRSARHPKRTRAGETQQALLAASQSSFGCQFCGWRSGSHVASSSSFTSSSASSLSASSPVIRLADDKTKTTSGSDGPPAATSGAQRPTNGCSSEGSRSLLGDWLARSVSSSVMTTGRKQSDRSPAVEPASRLSPYRQVARLLARQRPASSSDEQQVSSGAGRSKGRKLADLLFISPRKRRKPVEGDGGRECDLSERQAESAAALGKKKPAAHEISIEGAGPAPEAGPRDESGAHLDGAPSPKSSQLPSRPSSKDGPRDVCDELSGPDKQMRQDEDKKRALVKYANERSKLEQEEEGEEEARGLCAGSLREVRPAPDLAEAGACARFASGEMGAAFSRTASKSGVLIDPARDEQSAVGGDVGSPAELPIERLISLPNAELAPQQVARAGCELTLRQPSTEAIQQSGADGTGGGRGTPAPPSCETSAAEAPHVISPSTSLLPLIQPLASSCSSFASSSIRNLDSALTAESTSQQHLDCPAGDQAEPHSQVADAEEADDASGEVEIVASVAGADQSMSRTRSRSARPRSQPVSAPQTSATTATTTTSARDESTSEKLKSNFKKLVKRQQSVDSYRMAREQKQKLRREQQERDHPGANGGPSGRQHQSSEAIRMRGGGADGIRGGRDGGSGELGKVAARDRKFSMRVTLKEAADHEVPPHKPRRQERPTELEGAPGDESAGRLMGGASFQVEICVDPYARPGSFVLPGEQIASTSGNGQSASERPAQADRSKNSKDLAKPKISPTPPNTLSLMPLGAASAAGCPSPGSLLMGSGFSGCITPTYPTHHLPSPKYVSPAAFAAMQKKHSNASTISSSLGIDLAAGPQTTCAAGQNGQAVGNEQSLLFEGLVQTTSSSAAAQQQQQQQQQHQQPQLRQHSDSGSSFSLAASNRTNKSLNLTNGDTSGQQAQGGLSKEEIEARAAAEAEAAAAAQRRANLAEHIYDNKCGLGEDMKFLASLPEMCDITFLVGETREPVCAVRSVLAARSRVFHKILFGNRIEAAARAAAAAEAAAQRTTTEIVAPDAESSVADVGDDRRGSSPRQGGALSVLHTVSNLASKSSSRSSSPNQQAQSGQQQWSVTSDASGFNQRPAVVSRTDSTVTGDAGRSGRVSVASGGRESISQASQGSHQPLIIGPGQTTAPAPLRKGKKSRREDSTAGHQSHSRLSRMFLNKRASDPSIKQPHPAAHGQAASGGAGATSTLGDGPSALAAQSYYGSGSGNQSYLDKMSSSQRSTTVIIEEFEPDVFRQLIEYIHTGCVLLQARTLLGLLNAADYYGLEQLRRACLRFVSCCITVDTVCSLLSTAERYIQYKCTKSIVQKVLEFVDTHANDIFKLNAFGLLPEHVVRLILARDGLQADEQVKYEGVYTWCEHYCRSYELTNMADVMQNFLDLIQFHKIPTSVLLTEIYPTHIVPDEIFLSALAYQADPDVFEPQPSKQRRMTLPSSLMLSRNEEHSEHGHSKFRNAFARRQSNSQALKRRRSMLGARKSTGSSGVGGDGSDMSGGPTPSPISSKASGRKGSIAQVSISNVKRLSHRLPLRKRHSNMQGESLPKPPPTPPSPHPVAQQSSSPTTLHQTSSVALEPAPRDGMTRMGKRQLSLATGAASQNSAAAAAALAVSAAAAGNQQEHSRDPIQLGRQILDAYLAAKREQELEEERQKREAEAAEIERLEKELSSVDPNDPNRAGRNTDARTKRQPLVKTPSSSRKSFRDFKYISRKLFMRHSSSKSIQVQTSVSSGGSQQPKRLNSSDSSGPRQSADFQHRQLSQETQPAKARKLLKIRRSETVYEATPVTPEADGGHAGGRLLQQLSSNLRKG